MEKMNSDSPKKIVVMGLDNSGKTSIVMCLKGVKNLSSFTTIGPTRGIEFNKFNTLGSDFNIWDFGGQLQFRKDYFKNFNTHMKGTSKFIYVIDIQDRERYAVSLEYLAKIIQLLGKRTSDIDFSLFLHKCDPDLDIVMKDITDDVITKLITQIERLFPLDFPYQIYKTSISTVFQKSIV